MTRKTHDFPEFIGFKVPEQLARDVRQAAAQKGQTISHFIRSAIERELQPCRNEMLASITGGSGPESHRVQC